MQTLPETLRAARQVASLTQTQLAERLGLTHTTISQRETGKQDVPGSQLEAFVRETGLALCITPEGWRFEQAAPLGIPANPRRDQSLDEEEEDLYQIPLLGRASAGPGLWNDEYPVETVSVAGRWLTRLDGAILVQGDSMEPLLCDGDLVGVRIGEEYRLGDVVVAVAANGECLIKVYAGVHDGAVILASVNYNSPSVVSRPGEIEVHGVAYGLLRPERLRVRMRW